MCKDMPPLELAIQFHGHICPGLLMGVRTAEFAMQYLQVDPDSDEELGALVETDSCGVDAIQAILGCTFGKGNLYFRDYGKSVYTIFSREKGRAVRIAQNFGALDGPALDRFRVLRSRESLTAEEEAEKESVLAELFEFIMNQPMEKLFHWQEVDVPELAKAHIQPTVACQECGEGVMKSRTILTDRGLLCPDCAARGGQTDV